jgi:hypothetical protein
VNADHESARLLLGGYLLGGLDPDDLERLDAHLVDCASCRDELARLAPVPELLQRLPAQQTPPAVPAGARPSPERIDALLRRMRAERETTRRNRTRWLVAAAAAVAVLAVGVGVLGPNLRNGDPVARPSAPATQTPLPGPSGEPLVIAKFVAASGSAMAGEAVLTPKTWGVSVFLDLSSLPGEGPYVMQIRGVGSVEQGACWGRTPSGRARVTGASSLQLPTVQSVVVADEQGTVLGTARLRA